jgi:signal transduction histidine kinase
MKIQLDGMRLQLLGLIIVPFSLLVLALAIGGVSIHQGAMRRLVAERDERAVRAAASALSQELRHQEAAIHATALRLRDNAAPEVIVEQSAFLAGDFDLGLAILSLDGDVMASTGPPETWSASSLSAFLPSLPDGASTISPPFSDVAPDITFFTAERWADRIVLGASTLPGLMRTTVPAMADMSDYSVFLTDQSGNALAIIGADLSADQLKRHPGVQAALRGETGSLYMPAEDGEHVVAFSPILPPGWALVLEEPWETVANPILNISLVAPLALIPVLLVALTGLWFGASQVVGPLQRLEQKTQFLTRGEFDAPREPVGGIAEIQHLQKTLVLMSQRILAAQEALRGYINTMTRTQEDERRRLARELHDETIQDLVALGQQIQMLQMDLRRRGVHDTDGLQDLLASTQEAIRGVRRLSRGLRPIYLEELGLVPALEMLARDAQTELGTPVSFDVHGEIGRLDADTELALYRMVQEALSNVGRHAQSTHVWLRLVFEEEELRITIWDDGVGFPPPEEWSELAHQGHYGLIGIYERSVLIGAELDVDSSPGEGTCISIRLPLKAANA